LQSPALNRKLRAGNNHLKVPATPARASIISAVDSNTRNELQRHLLGVHPARHKYLRFCSTLCHRKRRTQGAQRRLFRPRIGVHTIFGDKHCARDVSIHAVTIGVKVGRIRLVRCFGHATSWARIADANVGCGRSPVAVATVTIVADSVTYRTMQKQNRTKCCRVNQPGLSGLHALKVPFHAWFVLFSC
jgi:hypothetical protein